MTSIKNIPIWTSNEAELATGGVSSCKWQAFGVSIDSRKIEPGDLFIAIPGENFDGHDFVNEALKKGACAAMVSKTADNFAKDAALLIVDDVMIALHNLAKFSRKRMQGKIIAVTGSVGKTSTKEMLAVALEGQGNVYCTIGNLNNHFGLPLSLARMPSATKFGIFEIGMNHPGEITPLTKLARPDVAIITIIAAVHLEFFKSLAEIADAKAEIFSGMQPEAHAILNFDNEFYANLAQAATNNGIKNITSFGEKNGADYRLLDYAEKSGQAIIKLGMNGDVIEYSLGIIGKHQAINSTAVLAAVNAVGADVNQAARNLKNITAKSGRGNTYTINFHGKTVTIIDDCYNASPVSMAAALDNLGNMTIKGRKIAVLGDMFELGPNAPLLHQNLNKKLLENKIDLLFTAGELMLNLFKAVPQQLQGISAKNSAELGIMLAKHLESNDALLIKGSRGMKMENVIKALS